MTALRHKSTHPIAKINPTIDRQLLTLFDSTDEVKVCMLDKAGRIIGWNASAERMTGYASADVMGKNYSTLISKEVREQRLFDKVLARALVHGSFMAQGIRVRKDGSHFWARSFVTPLNDPDGAFMFFALITRDITKEQELDRKRDEYIGIASHELRNPITTLSLYSELLAKRLELDRDKKNLGMLRDIQAQATRLISLVDDLLVVSKIEGGTLQIHREAFNPSVLITTVIHALQPIVPTHKLIYKQGPARTVYADKDRISQVLINLLTNAVKYSPGESKVLITLVCRGRVCTISVTDTGPGIAKYDQREIFSRFFRSMGATVGSVAGAGLGLYISKEIMKKHREKLTVKSRRGKGTTFSFTLPLTG